jgi:DNA-binding NarL/FixJ family response regulator
MGQRTPVGIIVGRLPSVISLGLVAVLRSDRQIALLESNLDDSAIEAAATLLAPRVAILGEKADPRLLVRLKSRRPPVRVLIFAQSTTHVPETTRLNCGASYLAWTASPSEIRAAVQRRAKGEPTFCLADDEKFASGVVVGYALTQKETEVFDLLSLGLSYEQIGDLLKIGPEAAKTHAANICRKLGVPSKRELIGRDLSTHLMHTL